MAATPGLTELRSVSRNGEAVTTMRFQWGTDMPTTILTVRERLDQARARLPEGAARPTLLTSDPLNPSRYQDGAAFAALQQRARLSRTWGDCYGYLLVASGFADVMLDPIMNPWDIAALVPVIRGAGGVISDWQGGSAYPASSTIAAGPELHAAVIAALNPRVAS